MNKARGKLKDFSALFLLCIYFIMMAPIVLDARDFNVSGKVTDGQDRPVSFAAIVEKNLEKGVWSDTDGSFTIRLPEGKNTLEFSSIGFKTETLTININKDIQDLEIMMTEESLRMQDVVVTAQQIKSSNGTSSYRIDDQAIRQIQAMSLGDIMTLLPGKKIGSTSYNDVQQADLRSAASSSFNNIGTAVIVNGMTLNNDANMQSTNPIGTQTDRFSTFSSGVDLRSISAAGIESVEVVTGVASAKYGNLASGAIIVKNKAGALPLSITASATATDYQAGFSKGFDLGKSRGILNVDGSYTYSTANPVFRKNFYQNVSAGLRWTRTLDKKHSWKNTIAFQTYMSFNGQRFEKDEKIPSREKVNNQNVLLNIYGDFKIKDVGDFSYSLNGSIDRQHSYYMSHGTGPVPLTEALETGTYITGYSAGTFKQEQIMKGLPMSLSGDFDMKNHIGTGNWRFHFLTGLQYSWDKNFGKGRSIVGNGVQTQGNIGSRSAVFHDIPASLTASLYHETGMKLDGKKADMDLRLGLRYDFMNRKHHLLSPRLNGSVRFFDIWKLRAAWGLSYKAPSMLQIYPGPAYFDFVNMSWFAQDPAERLAVVSTYVYDASNTGLKPSHTNTVELGTDLEWRWLTVRFTAFHKKLMDGIAPSGELMLLERQNYEVIERPVGRPPVVAPIEGDIDILPRIKNVMKNCREETTDGLELTIIPAMIEKTGTEFHFQGSYMKTVQADHTYHMQLSSYSLEGKKARYGVYEKNGWITRLCSGRLGIIQHFSQIGLIVTLNTELNFVDYREPVNGSIYPHAYYDHLGNYHDIPEEDRTSAEYKDLILNRELLEIQDKKPFYTNFHIQLRKETRQGHSFSLYMNNFLWLNPTYVFKEIERTLNPKIDFGISMSFTIGNQNKQHSYKLKSKKQ